MSKRPAQRQNALFASRLHRKISPEGSERAIYTGWGWGRREMRHERRGGEDTARKRAARSEPIVLGKLFVNPATCAVESAQHAQSGQNALRATQNSLPAAQNGREPLALNPLSANRALPPRSSRQNTHLLASSPSPPSSASSASSPSSSTSSLNSKFTPPSPSPPAIPGSSSKASTFTPPRMCTGSV